MQTVSDEPVDEDWPQVVNPLTLIFHHHATPTWIPNIDRLAVLDVNHAAVATDG